MWFLATFTWTASVLLIGCARWSPPPLTETNQLPMPGLAKESVVLEVTFVRIPAANTEFADHFWREVDEGWVNNQLRRRMAANGLRCGLLGESVPANLQKVLDAQQAIDPLKMMTDGQFGSDVIARTHQIRSQAGQPGKIVVRSGPIESVAALEFDESGPRSWRNIGAIAVPHFVSYESARKRTGDFGINSGHRARSAAIPIRRTRGKLGLG